ncbi:MAG: hypothetical protein ACM34I_09915 [bacterium]
MEKKRSTGVTLLGWFLIITSGTGILLNLYTMIFHKEFFVNYAPAYRFSSELVNKITSIIALFISGFKFILGVNILKLKEKWRKITFYYFLFNIVYLFSMVFVFVDPLYGLRAQSGPIVVYGLLMYFIARPKIKEQFKTRAQ